ncbi:MAG TPA: hypothetical protein VGJ74_11220 [Burkholderiales bacterium]
MAYRALIVLVLAIALASCASRRNKPAASQPAANTAAMPAQAAPPAATQSSSYMQTPGASYSGPLPPMEANRKINEQDCTKEVDLAAGNLRCR